MATKSDGGKSNILSFPESSSEFSIAAHLRENLETADGLILMHAFLKIASSEDRKKVIALAERLGGPCEQPGRE